MTRRMTCALIAVSVALTAATGPAHAESSSWFSRSTDAPEKKAAPQKPAQSQAKPNSSDIKKTTPSLVPATGDDAAYTAFDQGQYLTALKLAEAAAARGEPQANTLIARIYAEGLGVGKDEKTAVNWYARAAEAGEAAARMFEKAALTGHAEANYNLGLLFLKGDGKPENPRRAFQHILYAAEKGIAQAQYDVAAMYQSGDGVAANAEEAARWLSRAAGQGYAAAEYDYAVLLLKGMGLTKDEPKLYGYLKSAADKGVAGAQNRLAYLHLEGIGTAKNPVEAAKWRLIAQKNGIEDKTLDDMIAKLPKADRAKAITAASEWSDRIQVQTLD